MSLMDKIKKNSTITDTASLRSSKIFGKKDTITTAIPFINVALSGDMDGGLTPGLTVLAGPSRHFKTLFALVMASAFLKKYQDGIVLFYDSEFGTPVKYFESMNIDQDRIVHTPISDLEQLKSDIMNQLKGVDRNDHICIIVDSIGNLASKKEVDDALDGKTVADMTRAKAIKSLFRMVTPHLTIKDIPMIAINHTYQTMELYSKAVVSGGCVVAGTKIRSDIGLRNVEDFDIGDKVVTLAGLRDVTHIWNPETLDDGNPECYEIEFEDGHKVICSEKHKFLIDGKWIEAHELQINNEVSVV